MRYRGLCLCGGWRYKGVFDREVVIELPGGNPMIQWQESDNHIIQVGPSKYVFKGVIL